LFVRSTGYMLGNFFGWAEYIGCSVIVGWATAHPALYIGSRAFGES